LSRAGEPKVPDVVVSRSADWAAGANVTVVGTELTGPKIDDGALVAVTTQVPADPAANFDPLTRHDFAVPSLAVKVTVPVPEPPLTASDSDEP
jgi:hypothetical protein